MSTGFYMALILGLLLGGGVGFWLGWMARGSRKRWVA